MATSCSRSTQERASTVVQAERTKTREAVGHVRMRIRRDLGWTSGYPAKDGWHVVGLGAPSVTRTISGHDLQSGVNCVRRLVDEHRANLRRVVGDEKAWARSQLELIDAVKQMVRDGFSLTRKPLLEPGRWPAAIARRLHALLETELSELVTALAWVHWHEPKQLGKVLAWCELHGGMLGALHFVGASLDLVVRFTLFAAAERPARITNLAGWLTHRQTHGRGLERPKGTKIPTNTMADELAELVEAIACLDETSRRRALDAFNLIAAPSHLERWHTWWPRYEKAKKRVEQLVAVPDADAKTNRARKRLDNLTKTMPRPVQPTTLKRLVLRLAAPEHLDFFETLRSAMKDWPESDSDGDLRFATAAYWSNLDEHAPRTRAPLRQLMRCFGKYIRKRGAPGFQPWLSVLRSDTPMHRAGGVDYDLLTPRQGPARIETFFSHLEASPEPFDDEGADHLACLVLAMPAARVAGALEDLKRSPMWGEHISFNGMTVAAALTDRQHERFVPALRTLQTDDHQHVKLLTKTVAPLIGSDLVLDLLDAGHRDAMFAIAERLQLIETLGVDPEQPPRGTKDRAWLTEFPEDLRAALEYLAQTDDEAESTAERVIGRNKLQRELAGLRAIETPTAAQAARLKKLEDWRPRPLSADSIDRLSRKLREAGLRRFIATWQAQTDSALQRALANMIGAPPPPEWLADKEIAHVILELAKLKEPTRTLAARMLRLRLEPRPWDMRTAPRNERFLERATKHGIDVTPWLDPEPPQPMQSKRQRTMLVGIETDPLEVFRMGGYFGTCLSPGDVNFFSVVANACDINKRVVFARDESGLVLGRVLTALTDEHTLLVFNLYAHDRTLGVAENMTAYVHALARKMGVTVTRHGSVPRLVAAEWYDDGAIDVTEQHPALAEGSTLRRALTTLEPTSAAEHLAARIELNNLTLPVICGIAEVKKRPAIAAALIPHVAHVRLSHVSVVYLAHLLIAAEDPAAGRPIASAIASALMATHREHAYVPHPLLRVLAHADPRRTLEVLRATRPHGNRGLRDEDDPTRLYANGVALRLLHRPQQATRVLQHAHAHADAAFKLVIENELAHVTS